MIWFNVWLKKNKMIFIIGYFCNFLLGPQTLDFPLLYIFTSLLLSHIHAQPHIQLNLANLALLLLRLLLPFFFFISNSFLPSSIYNQLLINFPYVHWFHHSILNNIILSSPSPLSISCTPSQSQSPAVSAAVVRRGSRRW